MNRLGVFIIAVFLLVPSGVSAEWLMFGNDAGHNFVADITERTIQKRTPVTSWDRGSSSEEVYSWGSAVGNFTPNIGGDPYDRNVLHIVYITAEEDGDWLKGYLEIRDGGNPGKLMWQRDLGNIKNQNNQSLQTDFESYEERSIIQTMVEATGDRLDLTALIQQELVGQQNVGDVINTLRSRLEKQIARRSGQVIAAPLDTELRWYLGPKSK